jgi:hypothetical protein
LTAIRNGFYIDRLQSHLNLLNPMEFLSYMCGEQKLDGAAVLAQIEFDQNWPDNHKTENFFKEVVTGLSTINLRRLLRLTTGMANIPSKKSLYFINYF